MSKRSQAARDPNAEVDLANPHATYNIQQVIFFLVTWQRWRVLLTLISAIYSWLWQYGLWSFQTGGTRLEIFLLKNQHTQRKLLNFENWVNGEVSEIAKSPNLLTFKVNFLFQKLSESFSIFFSLKNINLGAHFLLLTFFDNINF